MLLRLVRWLARTLGYDVADIGSGLVVRRKDDREPLGVEPFDSHSWLVQQGGARRVQRLGGAESGTHLVIDDEAARRKMANVQSHMSHVLAEEQTAWMVRELDVNCVLDVGANAGQFAESLRRCGYSGRIVSFEPLAALVKQLENASADDPDWLVYGFALGDEEATMQINISGDPADPAKMSSLLPSSDFGKKWSSKLRDMEVDTVRVRRLDSVFEEAVAGIPEPRVFLKLDTQGFDLHAFRGAGHYLDQVVGLQSEVSCVPIYDHMPLMAEQLAVYEAAGFANAGMYQVSRHVKTLRVIEFDLMMVRPEAMAHGQPADGATV